MALINRYKEEGEKSLRDYVIPLTNQFDMEESDSMLAAKEYILDKGIIDMAGSNPFQGVETNNPYRHIERFTMLCNTLQQEGILPAWFRWNLFPFSLAGETKRWYAEASFDAKGKWETLILKFCGRIFSVSKL